MRIIKLSLKGLNSLADNVEIDFENDSILSSNRLYAITGPTGSGKSTLLDAISLALYGQTPRLKQGQEIRSILTNGQKTGFSSLVFTINNIQYKADWSIHRSSRKPYNVQAPKTYLSRLENGEWQILAQMSKEKTKLVEEITGLNYDEFTRAILLAQGNFAGFLNADGKTRASLLEKLTGTAHYKQLSKAIFALTKKSEERCKDKRKEIETLELLTTEQVQGLKKELQVNQELESKLQSHAKDIEKQLELHKSIAKQETSVEQAKQTLQLAQRESDKTVGSRIKLKKSEDLAVLREDLSQLANTQKSIKESKSSKEKLHDKQEAYKDTHEKLNVTKTKLQEKIDLSTFKHKEQSELFQKSYLPLKNKIESINSTLLEKSRGLIELEATFNTAQAEKQLAEERANKLSTEQKSVSEFLTQNRELEGFQMNDLEDLITQFNALKEKSTTQTKEKDKVSTVLSNSQSLLEDQLKSLDRKRQENTKLKHSFEKIKVSIVSNIEAKETFSDLSVSDIHKLKAHITKLSDAQANRTRLNDWLKEAKAKKLCVKTTFKQMSESLEKSQIIFEQKSAQLEGLQRVENERKIQASLEEHRENLKDGESCPLCGSLDHQLGNLHDNSSESYEGLKTELISLKNQIKEASEETKPVELEANKIQANIEHLTQNLSDVELELGKLADKKIYLPHFYSPSVAQEELEALSSRLETALEDKHNLDRIDLELTREDATYKEARANLRNLEQQERSLSSSLLELKDSIDAIQSKLKASLNRIQIPEDKDLNQELLDTVKSKVAEFDVKKHKLKSIVQEIQESNNELVKAEVTFTTAKTNLEGLQNTLKELEAELQTSRDNIKEVFDGDLEAHIAELKKGLDKLQQDQKKNQAQITECEANQKSSTKQISDLEKAIEQLVRSEDELIRSCISKAQFVDNELNDLNQVSECLLPITEEQKIRNDLKKIDEAVSNARTVQSERVSQLNELIKSKPEKSEEDLRAQLEPLNRELKSVKSALFEINRKITNQEERLQKQAPLLRQLEECSMDFEIWSKINDKLGSADGFKFSNLIQGLMLKHLIHYANIQLSNLTGRYRLIQNEKEPLNIDVIDSYLANSIRSCSTLSGGETFLVSLSLALSLSKMASKKTAIESLFMDEGFGTLDEDTLSIALSALDNLQAKGNSIGVISHVKELKEAIPAQIQVVPKGGGLSTVRVVG